MTLSGFLILKFSVALVRFVRLYCSRYVVLNRCILQMVTAGNRIVGTCLDVTVVAVGVLTKKLILIDTL